MRADLLIVCGALSVCAAALAPAATKHYSFSNGYPTTTARQPTQATFGSSQKDAEKTLVGTVTRVDAGDLIGVTPTGGRCTKVRLARSDAPEQGQPYGVEAKKFLFDLVNGKEVTVRYRTKDRAGTLSGTVCLPHEKGLVDVNLTLIRNGCAWYEEPAQTGTFSSETRFAMTYSAAQDEARAAKRGLWATPNPVRPAEWRKLRK